MLENKMKIKQKYIFKNFRLKTPGTTFTFTKTIFFSDQIFWYSFLISNLEWLKNFFNIFFLLLTVYLLFFSFFFCLHKFFLKTSFKNNFNSFFFPPFYFFVFCSHKEKYISFCICQVLFMHSSQNPNYSNYRMLS